MKKFIFTVILAMAPALSASALPPAKPADLAKKHAMLIKQHHSAAGELISSGLRLSETKSASSPATIWPQNFIASLLAMGLLDPADLCPRALHIDLEHPDISPDFGTRHIPTTGIWSKAALSF